MEARYEFRFFDADLTGYRRRMDEMAEASGTKASEEYYFVPVMPGDVNIKHRDGQLDIKQLLDTYDQFEKWYPVAKIDLPAKGITLNDEVMTRMGLEGSLDEQAEFDLDGFIRESVHTTPSWQVCKVIKSRQKYYLDECQLEFAMLQAGDTPMQTVAVEHTNPERIRIVLHKLGMDQWPNINYVKALNGIIWR